MISIFSKDKSKTIDFKAELFAGDFNEEEINEFYKTSDFDLNEKNQKGETLLIEALKKSKFKTASWLLKNGADVNISDSNGLLPFDIALEKENIPAIKLLLTFDQEHLDQKDKEGRTHLQNLVVLGNHDIAKLLIEAGADINNKDNNGRNVLFDALSFGNEKFIEYLLEQSGLEINYVDKFENAIMHHNEVYKNDSIAKKLIEAGADTTIKDKEGKTFLCSVALRGVESFDLLNAALEKGADINSRVANENTILMELVSLAAKVSNEEKDRRKSLFDMSKQIISKGLKTNAIDAKGETALFRAVRLKDIELTKFLLLNNVNPNIQNHDLQSALHFAMYQGIESLDIILLLLKSGATPLVRNQKNQTMYEILNNIILHTHGKKTLEDKFILSHIKQEGQYILILKEFLEFNKQDLDFLDTTGNPLFFNPLLNDHFQLFRLYIKNGLDVHMKNKQNHNILFEYILKVFTDNKQNNNFQNNLSMLMSSKLDHNVQDETGYGIVHKILGTPCNVHLFDTLTEIILFDYMRTDNLGRSVMHTAIWHEQGMIMKRIHNINKKVINVPDGYGILPITYAALLGNKNLVKILLELGSNVRSNVEVKSQAVEKFKPMLKNLPKLLENEEDSETIRQINILIDQVKRDFT